MSGVPFFPSALLWLEGQEPVQVTSTVWAVPSLALTLVTALRGSCVGQPCPAHVDSAGCTWPALPSFYRRYWSVPAAIWWWCLCKRSTCQPG